MTSPAYRGAWKRVRLVVLKRDHYQCRIRLPGCKGYASQVDHIVAYTHGGRRLDPTNLRAACAWCNTSRGGRTQRRRPPDELGPSRQW